MTTRLAGIFATSETPRMISNEVAELLDLLVARVGDPQRLYTQVYDGDSVLSIEDAEEEEDEPYPRILCPPVTSTTVSEAEQSLGFSLPHLLQEVYTQIGNGGLCLRLIGLEGGQTGG